MRESGMGWGAGFGGRGTGYGVRGTGYGARPLGPHRDRAHAVVAEPRPPNPERRLPNPEPVPASSILPETCYPCRADGEVWMAVSITLSHNALTNEPSSLSTTDPAAQAPAASAPLPPYAAPTTSVRFPLGWLLDHGSAALRYRAAVEVARLYTDAPPKPVAGPPYLARTSLLLAASQGLDGTWGQRMLTIPAPGRIEGVGMILAVRRLLESGWDRESPPIVHARRLLFRLLAEDNDPYYLFELRGEATDDVLARHHRQQLREAAAATLAQAGYETDPRLRGA